jgi:hypothetical protein
MPRLKGNIWNFRSPKPVRLMMTEVKARPAADVNYVAISTRQRVGTHPPEPLPRQNVVGIAGASVTPLITRYLAECKWK